MSLKVLVTEEVWTPGTVRTVREKLGKTAAEAGITEAVYKKNEANKDNDIKTMLAP